MKNLLLNNNITEMWKEASSPVEYLVALWITSLFSLATVSWFYLVIRFIMNPGVAKNITWGLIDYI